MAGTRIGRSRSKDDPAQVAKQGFDAMQAGRKRVVASSLMTKVQERVNSVLPDMVKARLHGLMAR
jgi:hypothetical protein